MGLKRMLVTAASAAVLGVAAVPGVAAAATDAPSAAPPCQVGLIGNGGGFSVCGGGGTHRVKLTCGNFTTVYGPWRAADGQTRSSAYCPVPTVVQLVDVQYRG
ncbi:hypothetical protein [Marinactinospora rubrisoli]|uniref:Secreted protein n=1 Tax=Marinactinospora rubrisoli TaxID=2715399 RepID=A0ABW2KBD3_9ACTN